MSTLPAGTVHLFVSLLSRGRVSRIRRQKIQRSCALCLLVGWCYQVQASNGALADLTLEQLAALPVNTVSKSDRPVADAPASIYLITESAIRRAGSSSLPEALRLAPNLQVARIDAGNYAITARGFNNPFANKLLVMIDGRTIYSPLFSGVFWDAQDVVLEDLDRIEVVSGPGGTLWGANAVNGVINIVSRSAADTQGEMLSVGVSSQEHQAVARYGGAIAGQGHYRVYAKHTVHDDTRSAAGLSTRSGLQRTQSGFRMDLGDADELLTVQGDVYSGRERQLGADDFEITGANLLTRKRWKYSPVSNITLQAYVDHSQRYQPEDLSQHLNTIDLDAHHEWNSGRYHRLVWGGGYRFMSDHVAEEPNFRFVPDDRDMEWFNLFVQDEIPVGDRVRVRLGSKLEKNPFTGWEVMPAAQIAWSATVNTLVWSSVSRVVRTPARFERELFSPSDPPVVDGIPQYHIQGAPGFTSEVMNVVELGYRGRAGESLTWSLTGFHSKYDSLRTLELSSGTTGLVFGNQASGTSRGLEAWGSWQVSPDWRLHGGVLLQDFDLALAPGSNDLSASTSMAYADPDYSGLLQSHWRFSDSIELNATLRHVDRLEVSGVPAYTALDTHLQWSPAPRLQLSLGARNLLGDSHAEFGRSPARNVYERAIFGKIVWGL